MAVEYRVYDPQKNEFLRTREHESEAIGDADAMASINEFSGRLEVHEITDNNLSTAKKVYEVRG
jgi:hypothetical protein